MGLTDFPHFLINKNQLRAWLKAGSTTGQPISVVLGVDPSSLNHGSLPPGDTLRHLGPFEVTPSRLYLALFDGTPPETAPPLPENLFFYQGDPRALLGVRRGFASEMVSIGGLGESSLDRETLQMLSSLLAPEASLYLYLHTRPDSQDLHRLTRRLALVGLEGEVQEVAVRESGTSLPIRSLLAATAKKAPSPPSLPPPDEKDPFGVVLRSILDRKDPDFRYVLCVTVERFRSHFPAPLAHYNNHSANLGFARRALVSIVKDPEQRERIAQKVAEAIQKLRLLFQVEEGPKTQGLRGQFLGALVREFPDPSSGYMALWTWFEEITGVDKNQLRRAHEKEILPVAAALLPPDGLYEALAKQANTLRVPEGKNVNAAVVCRALAAKTGLTQALLEERFGVVIRFWLWRHWGQLTDITKKALTDNLAQDLPVLRRLGYEPPYEFLPYREKLDKVRQRLREIFGEGAESIPLSNALEALHRRLREHGLLIRVPELQNMLTQLGDVLWEAQGRGLINARVLAHWNVPKPAAPSAPTSPPSPRPAPIAVISPPPPPQPTLPPLERPEGAATGSFSVSADLAEFLRRRGRRHPVR